MSRSVGDEIEIEMDSQRVLPVLIRKGGKRIGILYGADRRAVQGSVPAELLQDDVGVDEALDQLGIRYGHVRIGKTAYIEHKPGCPAGGAYALNAVEEKCTCSIPKHAPEP